MTDVCYYVLLYCNALNMLLSNKIKSHVFIGYARQYLIHVTK